MIELIVKECKVEYDEEGEPVQMQVMHDKDRIVWLSRTSVDYVSGTIVDGNKYTEITLNSGAVLYSEIKPKEIADKFD